MKFWDFTYWSGGEIPFSISMARSFCVFTFFYTNMFLVL